MWPANYAPTTYGSNARLNSSGWYVPLDHSSQGGGRYVERQTYAENVPPVHDYTAPLNPAYGVHTRPLEGNGSADLQTVSARALASEDPMPQEEQTQAQRSAAPKRKRASQKARYSASDWEFHRLAIKELYVDQDWSLEDTMAEIARRAPDFHPAKKLYKERVEEWGFLKHLPAQTALWMDHKAKQRSQPDAEHPKGRDTRFGYGTLVLTKADVQKRIKRANMSVEESKNLDTPTPKHVIYETPRAIDASPSLAPLPGIGGVSRRWTRPPSPKRRDPFSIPQLYGTRTLADMETVEKEACWLDAGGQSDRAEELYCEALDGFRTILSPTHDRTIALAYKLAAFYTDRDRPHDADGVLNWTTEKIVRRWGQDDDSTLKHLLRVSNFYNSWARNDEALSLIYRILDTLDGKARTAVLGRSRPGQGVPEPTAPRESSSRQAVHNAASNQAPRTLMVSENPSAIEYQLQLANVLHETGAAVAEDVIILLIEQCEHHQQEMSAQTLKARCMLVNFYQSQGKDEEHLVALSKAREAVYQAQIPDKEDTESILMACVDVGKLHLQAEDDDSAEDIFQHIASKADDFLNKRFVAIVSIFIRIGTIYQGASDWTKAEPWFERALAACIAARNGDGAVARTLTAALETGHYSSGPLMEDERDFTISFGDLRRAMLL